MKKKIRIVRSPFHPPLEVIDKIVLKIDAPYSDHNVTIQVCPNIEGYAEDADANGILIRQLIYATPTDQTTTISFDLVEKSKKTVVAEGTEYEIELLRVEVEEIHGQQFKAFEFNVSWI